jgi:hypothetical protein
MYFSYAIFLTDYKKILKVAGGVKQLTVPLLPDPNSSMPENYAQWVIPVKCSISFKTKLCPNFVMVWYADIIFSGFVVMCMYIMIIKQLFHACSGNSQNYCPSVLESRPQTAVLKSSPAPRINSFHCSLNRHEITVY